MSLCMLGRIVAFDLVNRAALCQLPCDGARDTNTSSNTHWPGFKRKEGPRRIIHHVSEVTGKDIPLTAVEVN